MEEPTLYKGMFTSPSPEIKPSLKPIALKFGLMGAGFVIAVNLISYLTGMMDASSQGGAGNIVLGFGLTLFNWGVFTFIYFLAVKAYREELGGYISFGQGFKAAFSSVLVKAGILLIWGFIFYNFIISGFSDMMLENIAAQLEQQSLPEETFDMMMGIYEVVFTPTVMSFSTAISTILGGALLSTIAAAIGQKEPEI